MLSCLLNKQRINCCDGLYSKEELKKWAAKKILLCPACGKPYEYCHGKVKSPYFRHMDKEQCEDKYSEAETEEHVKGKKDLYEWIRKQDGVTDVILEGWIPATKQRPDIMFKYNGEQCVIEYQCTPISSEYFERHELYKAAGIKDIWILGIDKYFTTSSRRKYIQNVAIGHYSPISKDLILYEYKSFYDKVKDKDQLKISLYGNYDTGKYYGRNINNYMYDEDGFTDIFFEKLKDINKKIERRKNIVIFKPRICNTYLDKQKDINWYKEFQYENIIKNKLFELCNDNWGFGLQYTKSRYKRYCYICASPKVKSPSIHCYTYEKETASLKNMFEKIKLWKLTEEEKIRCCNDIDYLKKILVPIMQRNRDLLLNHSFNDFRILEVKK